MLRTSNAPFGPLTANSVASITKKGLKKMGLNVSVWKPHSTRGAAVSMFKKWGFSSEEVCEIGKWKNVQAFASHYLRLGATQKIAHILPNEVHKVSPMECAECDLTCTPRRGATYGGNVREHEAQNIGDPDPPTPKRSKRGQKTETEKEAFITGHVPPEPAPKIVCLCDTFRNTIGQTHFHSYMSLHAEG